MPKHWRAIEAHPAALADIGDPERLLIFISCTCIRVDYESAAAEFAFKTLEDSLL